MASTTGRRVMSHRPLERQNTRGDDPWCLICGVNLALDGRTFTIISGHQSSEICDVLIRVLGMNFIDDHATVNVCNRCERQMKRLGRANTIAVARQEGRKFREQVGKNLAKHTQTGVEVGDFRDFTSPTSATRSTQPVKDGTTSAIKRGKSFDSSSGKKDTKERDSRSNSSVRFEDDKEIGGKGAYTRDHSAPERQVQKRESFFSSVDETDRFKDARKGTRSSLHSTSVERALSLRSTSDSRKLPTDRKTPLRSSVIRDRDRSTQKPNSVDLQKTSVKSAPEKFSSDNGKSDSTKTLGEGKKESELLVSPSSEIEKIQNSDNETDSLEFSFGQNNPFIPEELKAKKVARGFESSGAYDDVSSDDSTKKNVSAERLEIVEPGEEPVKVRFKKSSKISESSSESDSSEVNVQENIDSSIRNHDRDRDSQHVTDEGRDGARKFKVTFSESVDTDDTCDETHTTPSEIPEPPGDTSSTSTPTNKGKLSQYESLDLELEKNNPFFDDVYGEYNRRVFLTTRIRKSGMSPVNIRGAQKPEPIPEIEGSGETWELESQSSDELVHEGTDTQQNYTPGSQSQHKDLEISQDGTLLTDNADDLEKAHADGDVKENGVTGENQQDSAPLITDNDEDKEENRGNEDLQVVNSTTSEFGGTAPEDPEDATDSQKEAVVRDDKKDQEDEAKQPIQGGDDDVIVSEVSHGTQLAPSAGYDADPNPSGSVSFVKDVTDENDSQISIKPVQVENTPGIKSEVSPLIDKDGESSGQKPKKGDDSKFKDQQPGLPCCTIL